MIIPYISEQLFKVGNYKVTKIDDVLIIDDWYQNYEQIHEVLQNSAVPRWKWHKDGRNFKDYYDCRLELVFNYVDAEEFDSIKILTNIINENFDLKQKVKLAKECFEFNYYKNIKNNVSSDLQHHPHTDEITFNVVIYLDKICSGGTAIYDDMINLRNNEHMNLLYDVSGLNKRLIQAKPNRIAVFNGKLPHGGYIEDHNKYVNDWRVNQVLFFD